MNTPPTLEIFPLQGLGTVRLGSSRADVRTALSSYGFPLERSHHSLDYFCDASIQVEFDPNDHAWFIGISCANQWIALYKGQDIFLLSASELFDLVATHDNSGVHQFEPSEYRFPNQILTLWDSDTQYDHKGHYVRPVWAQVGIGNAAYLAAITAIQNQ